MGLLKESGHEVVFAPGFEPAIRKLDQIAPDLLITDVRLGGFNGLHLVIRSQSSRPKMRSILLDRVHDPVVALDAERQGAVVSGWAGEPGGDLRADFESAQRERSAAALAAQAADQGIGLPRRAPVGARDRHQLRRHPSRVAAGGNDSGQVPHGDSRIRRRLPRQAGMVAVTPLGSISCGAELLEANPQVIAQWRQLVDTIHAGA